MNMVIRENFSTANRKIAFSSNNPSAKSHYELQHEELKEFQYLHTKADLVKLLLLELWKLAYHIPQDF